MKINSHNIYECISAFVKTMDAYDFITREIPISKELKGLLEGTTGALDISRLAKSDSAFVDIRLMLQRKYFTRTGNVYLPDLLQKAASQSIIESGTTNDLLSDLDEINNRPLELASPNGTVIVGSYKIAETIIYGYYLHADTDKIDSLHQIPIRAITLAIAPFVLKREEILHKAAVIFKNCQTEIPMREAASSGFLLLDSRTAEKRQIKASPFWINAYVHDDTFNEIEMAAQANSYEDNLVILLAGHFFEELARPDYDKARLRKLVWKKHWKQWGDFSEGHEYAASFEDPGFSSKVLHEGGQRYAQVKLFPHVISPWETSTKQYPLCETCLVTLEKHWGKWKINGLAKTTIDET
jgi:hypothetical protein